jgi:hypothetical protein
MAGKNKRRRNRKKGNPIKGVLMMIEGELRAVTFDIPCSFCNRPIKSFPIRIPKPGNWKWIEGDQISYDVYYCCTRQPCVESGANKYREALVKGIEVDGEPPENLFPPDTDATEDPEDQENE